MKSNVLQSGNFDVEMYRAEIYFPDVDGLLLSGFRRGEVFKLSELFEFWCWGRAGFSFNFKTTFKIFAEISNIALSSRSKIYDDGFRGNFSSSIFFEFWSKTTQNHAPHSKVQTFQFSQTRGLLINDVYCWSLIQKHIQHSCWSFWNESWKFPDNFNNIKAKSFYGKRKNFEKGGKTLIKLFPNFSEKLLASWKEFYAFSLD